MSLMKRLQRRFGRYAIPNLTLLLLIPQAALYVLSLMPEGFHLERLLLDPQQVMHGEVWRIITFIFMPPAYVPVMGVLVVFYFMLLHLFGTTLERQWGDFRYNVYLLIGFVASAAAAFAASALTSALNPELAAGESFAPLTQSNGFLYGTIFLAFARYHPQFSLSLFFILPVPVRWMAMFAWAGYGYAFFSGDWPQRIIVAASVLNYLLFFAREHVVEWRHWLKKQTFESAVTRAVKPPTHVCRVCRRSSDEEPRTLFRYCTKCAGQACYCPDHIAEHEHLLDSAASAT